jgi:hypothetical protein
MEIIWSNHTARFAPSVGRRLETTAHRLVDDCTLGTVGDGLASSWLESIRRGRDECDGI